MGIREHALPDGGISIHAPREGSDHTMTLQAGAARYFYPRSPRGERRFCQQDAGLADVISIHAPREGSDVGML